MPAPSIERLRETARGTFGRLAACGVTSAGVILQTDEEGPGGASGRLESLALLLLVGELPFAPYSIFVGRSVETALAARATPLHDPAAGRRVGGFRSSPTAPSGAAPPACASPSRTGRASAAI